MRPEVPKSEADVYELIWKRTVGSQMTDAVGETVQVRVGAAARDGRRTEFAASGTVITHQGFRRVYVEDTDDDDASEGNERRCRRSPSATISTSTISRSKGHETQPPARYTEASLVKRLEELGVGRPSTYASIMGTIQDRGYVWKRGSALVPTFTAFSVVGLLEQHFPDLVDYDFTARWRTISTTSPTGVGEAIPWLSEFYFGPTSPGLKQKVSERLGEIDARAVNSIPLGVDANGEIVVARVGKYGPYVQRGEDTASIPDEIAPDELTVEAAIEFLEAPSGDRELGIRSRHGLRRSSPRPAVSAPIVQLGEHDDETGEKPRTASLFSTMTLETVTLDEALQLLSLPRVVGVDPDDGDEITVQNGRYGPYLKKGTDSRSLETEDQLFTITLDEAWPSWPSRSVVAGRRPSRRCASWATTRDRQAHGGQGRPIRPLRHRRRDQRVAAQGRHRRGAHRRAGRGAAADAARSGTAHEEGHQEEGRQEEGDQQEGRQEEGDQEDGGQEDGGQEAGRAEGPGRAGGSRSGRRTGAVEP